MKQFQILLAEDNLGDVVLIGQALREHDIEHKLHVVEDGEQALEYLLHMGQPGFPPCPDVLLLDLNLPRVDGPQVLSEFRRHLLCGDTPVIIVTSSYSPRDQAKLAAFGIAHYFRKPSDLDQFMRLGAIVKEVVRAQSA